MSKSVDGRRAITRGIAAIGLLGLLLISVLGPAATIAQDGTVQFYFFYSEECDQCRAVKEVLFPTLEAQYGDQLEITSLEISDVAAFERMAALEEQFGVPPDKADIPEIYIGDEALIGAEEIQARLPGLVEQYAAGGGVDLPEVAATASTTSDTGEPVARFYLFYGESCPHCHTMMDEYLPTVYEKYGDQVESEYIEVWADVDQYVALLGLETKLGVPEDRQGAVPVLVIGDKVMVGGGEIPERLEGYIDAYLSQGGVDYPSLDDLPEVVLPTPEPTVEMLVLFDPDQADSQRLTAFITSLGQKHGAGLQAFGADSNEPENVAILQQLNTAFGVVGQPPGTPQILVGREMLVGIDQIETRLPTLVEELLAQGGSSIPTLEELLGTATAPEATAPPASAEPVTPQPTAEATLPPLPTRVDQAPVHLAYFYKTGCQECDRAKYDLNYIQQTYPQVQIVEFNIEEEQALAEWLGERLQVPEEERLESPAIFIGSDHLVGETMTLRGIQTAVEDYVSTGAEPTWEEFGQQEQEKAEESLIERYRSLGALTVFAGGLVNGLNPCAFVTIVFFLSYLAFMGRGGREILIVGGMFTLGVFLTYLLAGLGLSQLLEPLGGLQSALKRWVFGFTALLCIALAAVSIHDYIKARQGKTDEMKLKLSLDLRRRVNKVIREGSKMRGFYLVAFGVGALVSLIQLTCTSPIYVGILFLIHDVPEMQSNAFWYLLIYNLAYIVPLVIVFLVAYFGTSSEQLGDFITERTAPIKLLTALVFIVLAGWLIYSLLPLFGVT